MRKLTNRFIRNLINIPGRRFSRRLVVFESDDWGALRMTSKETYDHLLSRNIPVDKCQFNKNDSLETNSDLICLFDTLKKYRDCKGNHPVITANTVVANPDFKRIAENNFQTYFFEPFTETLLRLPDREKVYALYKEGMHENIFHPQFHGREHVNVVQWMNALQEGDSHIRNAFEVGVFSVPPSTKRGARENFMATFDAATFGEEEATSFAAIEGLDLFSFLFGFQSKSFIAPCYVWFPRLEEVVHGRGVEFIQGVTYQYVPSGNTTFKKKFHFQGQKNKAGQMYFVRNCFFEPSVYPNVDWVDECLARMEIAFKWKKPAIIGTHRVNFIGSIRPENREMSLALLDLLLKRMLAKWPDIEFTTTDRLHQY